jgi:sarcosine oxidase delta subunit
VQVFPCPFCGERPDAEFRYGGDARKARPARDCSDAEWAQICKMGGVKAK